MKAIQSVFFMNIPIEYRQQFINSFVKRNLKRTLVMAAVIMVLELVYLSISFIPNLQSLYGDKLTTYRVLYIFIIAYTGVHVLIIWLMKDKLLRHIRLVEIVLHIAAIILLTWSGILSVVDMTRGLQGFLYIFIGMAIAVIMVMRPSRSSLVYLTAHVVFIILNFVYNLPKDIIFSNIVNTTSVMVTAFIVSIILFRSASRDFIKQQIITEQRDALEHASQLDPLTGLYNRRGLEAKLEAYKLKMVEDDMVMAVIMIDIDYFKEFNDTYGHIEGDQALVSVAEIIKWAIEGYDGFGCRYGGDEFSMVIYGEADEIIVQIIEKLKRGIGALDIESKASRSGRLDIGVGYHIDKVNKRQDPWVLIDQADQALYSYKRSR